MATRSGVTLTTEGRQALHTITAAVTGAAGKPVSMSGALLALAVVVRELPADVLNRAVTEAEGN